MPLPRWLLYRYWVIQHVYEQQREMYQSKSRRCDDRIVSISQPYVRPIIRGKLNTPVADLRNPYGFEVYYNFAINKWAHLTADLQLAKNEWAADNVAVIPGVRLVIDF